MRIDNRVIPDVKSYILKNNIPCPYCGGKLNSSNITKDHIIPKAKGGQNNIENYIYCCNVCNRLKGRNSLSNYMRGRSYVFLINYLNVLSNRINQNYLCKLIRKLPEEVKSHFINYIGTTQC